MMKFLLGALLVIGLSSCSCFSKKSPHCEDKDRKECSVEKKCCDKAKECDKTGPEGKTCPVKKEEAQTDTKKKK
ncbi:MAG: hypothetical protein U0T83_09545 [Bacteriovoracaceae bacterium]